MSKISIRWRLNSKTLRVKLAPFKRLLMNKVLRWNILKTRAGGTILEFQEYRNLLMKRGRLLKRKSKKQSGRSLIWKSILSNIERGHRVERKKKPEAAKKLGQPRTIVCRLKNWKQKEAVVRKVMKEKPVGLFICEGLGRHIGETSQSS